MKLFTSMIHYKPEGRHNRIPLEQRICQYCNLNKIEDECHFIVYCTLYNNKRNVLFENIQDMFPISNT